MIPQEDPDQTKFVFEERKPYQFIIRIEEGEDKGKHVASVDAYDLKEARRMLKNYYPEARSILVLVN